MLLKDELRKEIAILKKQYTQAELDEFSAQIMSKVEQHPLFKKTTTVMLYYSIKGEVSTREFVKKWSRDKNIFLPAIENGDIEVRAYKEEANMVEGSLKVMEPKGEEDIKDLNNLELVIVPGVAFDKKGNRMGRGKGYYDRFLRGLAAYKIGICFPFQMVDEIPHDDNDIPMDEVVSL